MTESASSCFSFLRPKALDWMADMPAKVKSRESEDELAASLDERYGQINQLWKEAEKRLKRFSVPEDVSVIYHMEPVTFQNSPNPNDDYTVMGYRHLGFCRLRTGWVICFATSLEDDSDRELDWRPIAECSVEVRLHAVEGLKKLKSKVIECAGNSLATLEQTIAHFEHLLTEF